MLWRGDIKDARRRWGDIEEAWGTDATPDSTYGSGHLVSAIGSELAWIEPQCPTTILHSTGDVAALKESEGGAIFIHGSAELARRLSDEGLIDQYNLLIFPVLLGAGKSLFSRADRNEQVLRLRESEK